MPPLELSDLLRFSADFNARLTATIDRYIADPIHTLSSDMNIVIEKLAAIDNRLETTNERLDAIDRSIVAG